MSTIRKACIEAGCPNYVDLQRLSSRQAQRGLRCPQHQRVHDRAQNKIRHARPHQQAYRDPSYHSIPIGGICHICGLPGADTRDHVIPLSRGGTNHPSNIRPAHKHCNESKGAKTQSA